MTKSIEEEIASLHEKVNGLVTDAEIYANHRQQLAKRIDNLKEKTEAQLAGCPKVACGADSAMDTPGVESASPPILTVNAPGLSFENKSKLDVDLGVGKIKFRSTKKFKVGMWGTIVLFLVAGWSSQWWGPILSGSDGGNDGAFTVQSEPVYIYRTDPRADAAVGFCQSVKADQTAYYNLPMSKQRELDALLNTRVGDTSD